MSVLCLWDVVWCVLLFFRLRFLLSFFCDVCVSVAGLCVMFVVCVEVCSL